FDELNRGIQHAIWRDNKVVQTTATQYNAFNNPIAEGPGDGTWNLYRHFDDLNHCWLSNAKTGVATITLRNLAGQETVSLQSATQDLSQITYTEDQLDDLMSLSTTDLERTETQRDAAGRKTVTTMPKYSQRDPNDPADAPLHIIASKSY